MNKLNPPAWKRGTILVERKGMDKRRKQLKPLKSKKGRKLNLQHTVAVNRKILKHTEKPKSTCHSSPLVSQFCKVLTSHSTHNTDLIAVAMITVNFQKSYKKFVRSDETNFVN